MSIKGVLLRFFLLYIGLIGVTWLIAIMLGLRQNSGINSGILMACVLWACYQYGKKNGRYFLGHEKTMAILGFIAIDSTVQLLFTVLALAQSPSATGVNTGRLAFAVGFVCSLHAIAICLFVGVTRKLLVQQKMISD